MLNPNLALIPSQGVRDQGQVMQHAGNSLLNALQYSQQKEYQNRLFQAQQDQQAFNNNRVTQQDDINNKTAQFKLDQQTGSMLYREAVALKALGPEDRVHALDQLKPKLLALGMDEAAINDGLDDNELNIAINALSKFAPTADEASTRAFESRAKAAGLEPGTDEYKKAAMVELGLVPRAASSAQERIASDPNLSSAVADSEAAIEGAKATAKEGGKLKTQLQLMPKIKGAIKQAETEAKDRGETLSAYNRAQAALPGLKETVNKLKTLADVATYTIGGKAMDQLAKQLGFGATEGSTARAKMVSIVDNQVLPLLRDTFGAQFTAAEGDRLRDAFLNPDSSPEEKKAQLDSFLDQKIRTLEAQETELGINGFDLEYDPETGSFK